MSPKTVKKPKKRKVESNGKKVTANPIENQYALSECLKYEYSGGNIGGLLLRKEDKVKVVFGFHCEGINNIISKLEIDSLFDPLEEGIRDFPPGETLTIHQSLFVDSSERTEELQSITDNAPTPELKFFIMGETLSTKKVSDAGERKKGSLDIYCTYTPHKTAKNNKDFVDKTLEQATSLWDSFTGNKKQAENKRLQEILEEAYEEGYERWYNLLTDKLGLDIKSHTTEEIWHKVTTRFIKRHVEIPQIIHVDEEEISLTQNSQLHPVSHIFARDKVPTEGEDYIQVKDKYVGVLNLMDKAEGWKDKIVKLRSMWTILSKERNYDTEIICQIEMGNQRRLRDDMDRLAKQAQNDSKEAEKKDQIDVGSKLKQKKALEAQEKLYENRVPFYTSTVFLVHRNSKKALDSACNALQDQFFAPLQLHRERVYPHRIWQQTVPICWERLLVEPYDRRWTYTNDEIPAIVPLVMPNSKDKKGIEFLSKEGKVPVYLNLWQTEIRHMMLLATNRAGKGVLLARIIMHHLARGVPVSVMDYPRADGTSTFSYIAEFLGDIASYFNTSEEAFNIFEIPDLSKLSPQKRQLRMNDFMEFLIDILQTMVIGTQPPVGINPSDVKTILTVAVDKFYSQQNVEIYQRFRAAYRGGFGSPEWEETPVLADFVAMLGPESLKMPDPTPQLLRCIEFVKLRLNYWLKSRIGKAISRPSTVKADDLLVVYAMANLNSEEDAAVLTLAVNMQGLRKSMEHEASVILVDEVSILVKFDEIAKMVGRFCANGAKSGIQILLAGQNVDSISRSPYGKDILDNVPIKLIGRLQPTAIDSMVDTLKYAPEIISKNASKSFEIQPRKLATSWLLECNNRINIVEYRADPLLMAVVANNPKEMKARNENLAKHPDDKYLGLKAFADEIENKCRSL